MCSFAQVCESTMARLLTARHICHLMNPIVRFFLISAFLLTAYPAFASDSSGGLVEKRELVTLPSESPGRWSRPWRVVLPDYPQAALKQGRTAVLDLKAEIDAVGTGKITEIKAEPADAAFIEAVERVFGFWRFYVGTDEECRPKLGVFKTRVWFEIENGKPKLSFSALQDRIPEEYANKPYAKLKNGNDVVNSLERMQLGSLSSDATVYLKIKVDPASGKARELTIAGRAGGGAGLRDAVSAVQRAYLNAEFDVPQQFRDQAIVVCHLVDFR